MLPLRTARPIGRFLCGAVLALLLALRALAPAGFMPVFDHGRVTIVACPDANAPAVPAMHHHHKSADHGFAHQPCPYAAASALGALGPDLAPLLLTTLFFAAALLLGRTFLFIERNNARERPPLRGPPLPA